MPQDRKPLPPTTIHKTWAGALTALAIQVAIWAGGRWGLEMSVETLALVSVVLTPLATGFAVWFFRNWERVTGAALYCHPLPVLAAIGLALLLSGCAGASPRVEAAGDRALHAVEVGCQTLDGAPVAITVDVIAAVAGQTDRVALARQLRQAVCAAAGYVAPLAPQASPVPIPRPGS